MSIFAGRFRAVRIIFDILIIIHDMKRFYLILSAALMMFSSFSASAAENAEPKNNFKLYGFVRNYFI